MYVRFIYAFIGAIGGAFAGFVVWWLLGFGAWPRGAFSIRGMGLASIAKDMALFGAVCGFFWKDEVGDAVGSVIAKAFHIRMGTQGDDHWYAPVWIKVVVVAAVVLIVWYFV